MNARTIPRALVTTTVPTRRVGNLPADQLRVVVREETFAERVRRFRRARGLRILDLAERSGIAAPTIKRIEQRVFNGVSAHTLDAIARALDVSMETLWRGEP